MVGDHAEGSETAEALVRVSLISRASREQVYHTSAHAVLLFRGPGFDGSVAILGFSSSCTRGLELEIRHGNVQTILQRIWTSERETMPDSLIE